MEDGNCNVEKILTDEDILLISMTIHINEALILPWDLQYVCEPLNLPVKIQMFISYCHIEGVGRQEKFTQNWMHCNRLIYIHFPMFECLKASSVFVFLEIRILINCNSIENFATVWFLWSNDIIKFRTW